MAGKSSLVADHPCYVGPIGVTGCDHANRLAAEADLVLAVGTRLQDFTTGSWTVFGEGTAFVALNTARFDATKHFARPLVADARDGLAELEGELAGWRADEEWTARGREEATAFRRFVAETTRPGDGELTYAQVVGAVNRAAGPDDYAAHRGGRLARRAERQLAAQGHRARSTASTGSRAWATRSQAPGGRAWHAARAR